MPSTAPRLVLAFVDGSAALAVARAGPSGSVPRSLTMHRLPPEAVVDGVPRHVDALVDALVAALAPPDSRPWSAVVVLPPGPSVRLAPTAADLGAVLGGLAERADPTGDHAVVVRRGSVAVVALGSAVEAARRVGELLGPATAVVVTASPLLTPTSAVSGPPVARWAAGAVAGQLVDLVVAPRLAVRPPAPNGLVLAHLGAL